MKKFIGTRIDEEEKKKLKKISDKYKMSESVLLRLLALALVKDDTKLMPIIMEILKDSHEAENIISS